RTSGGWHDNFNPKDYDGARSDAALADMQKGGFNVVRVFIDNRYPTGISGGPDQAEFSKGYIDCLCDYLSRARSHGIRVIITNGGVPNMTPYSAAYGERSPEFGRHNRLFLEPESLKAKARFIADMVAAVKARDASLLPVVLAWELDNESCFMAGEPPFSLPEGKVTAANGKTYDMAVEGDLQRMADEAGAYAAETCARAVRAVDPDAMFTVNVFTFRAVGRTGPGMLRRETSRDQRFPFNLVAFTGTSLDYLDVHFYPPNAEQFANDLKSIEFDKLRPAAAAAGKPLIVGEFGVFKSFYKEQGPAIDWMRELLGKIRANGFTGWLYWTYECKMQPEIWHARDVNDNMLRMLTEEAERWRSGGAK
ncbi:MAG: glycoside hydrolase family 5 protein, partial [bacterium]|nr:glycoside hydrolase family 5 protein [bacterium]